MRTDKRSQIGTRFKQLTPGPAAILVTSRLRVQRLLSFTSDTYEAGSRPCLLGRVFLKVSPHVEIARSYQTGAESEPQPGDPGDHGGPGGPGARSISIIRVLL